MESHEPITRYLNRMAERDPEFREFPELVKTVREIAARMGVRKFAWREFAKLLMMEIYKGEQDIAAGRVHSTDEVRRAIAADLGVSV